MEPEAARELWPVEVAAAMQDAFDGSETAIQELVLRRATPSRYIGRVTFAGRDEYESLSIAVQDGVAVAHLG